jgi:YVTN family beta-propeller protein
MRDKQAAMLAGLKTVTHDTCLGCHADAHGKPFDVESAWQQILHPTKLPPPPEEVRYKTPQNMAFHPGGRELYVTCEAADAVAVVDVARQTKIAEIPVGGQPNDVTFHPGGQWAYVSNRLDDTVSVIDVATRKVVATIPVGDEPHGVLTDREGRLLYVLNTSTDSISVIDTQSLKEVKRLEASRNPWALSLSPDGSQILVTNALSRFVPFRQPHCPK